MAITINTNLLSLNAQRNLRKTEQPLQAAMERLSSGLRINSSRDDAAGLAIATRQTRQIAGITVAMRNANDGVSLVQTAEGAMTEMVTGMQRIYELAVQSASYNTSVDRGSLNQEVTELVAELNRIVDQTRFNGEKFLNQAFSANLQVGTEVNEFISVSTSSVAPNSFGVQSTRVDFTNTSANQTAIASAVAGVTWRSGGLSNSATLAGVDLGDVIAASDVRNNSGTIINRVNQYTGQTDVTAFTFGNAFVGTAAVGGSTADVGAATNAVNSGYLTINGITIGSATSAASTVVSLASAMVSAINNKTGQTGVVAVYLSSVDTGAADPSIALVNTNGAAITVAVATANAGTASAFAGFFGTSGGSVTAGQNGQIVFSTPLNTTAVSTNAASENAAYGMATSAATISISNAKSVNTVDVQTVGAANLAILAVKQGLETINTEKAKLGAKQNRIESTIRNLDNVRENVTAARSRIMDADFAAETSNLTKSLILQQAGISVLTQANQTSQNVLALLQG